MEAFGQNALAAAIGFHHTDEKPALIGFGKGYQIAARRPDRRCISALAITDAPHICAIGFHYINLLCAHTIGLENDLPAIGRVARRGINGERRGKPPGFAGTQIHCVNIRIAIAFKAHHNFLAVGRKPWGKGHARKITDDFLLSGLDIQQINTRLVAIIGQIGDFLRGWAEARGQRQRAPVGQFAAGIAVLIHDC